MLWPHLGSAQLLWLALMLMMMSIIITTIIGSIITTIIIITISNCSCGRTIAILLTKKKVILSHGGNNNAIWKTFVAKMKETNTKMLIFHTAAIMQYEIAALTHHPLFCCWWIARGWSRPSDELLELVESLMHCVCSCKNLGASLSALWLWFT